MRARASTGQRVQMLSLPFIFLACIMMWYHLATGWRPYWYDVTVLALIIGNIIFQAIYFFFYHDV